MDLLLAGAAAQDRAFDEAGGSSRVSAWRSLPVPGAPAARVRGALHYGDLVILSVPDRSAGVRCCAAAGEAPGAPAPRVARLAVDACVGGGLGGGDLVWRVLPADGIDRCPAGAAGLPIRSGSTVVLRHARLGLALSVDAASRPLPLPQPRHPAPATGATGASATALAAVALHPLPSALSGLGGALGGREGPAPPPATASQRWVILAPDAALAASRLLDAGLGAAGGEHLQQPFVMAAQHFALLCHGTGSASDAGAPAASQGARAALLQMRALQRVPGSPEPVVDAIASAAAHLRLGAAAGAPVAQLDALVSNRPPAAPHAALWSCTLVDDSPGQLLEAGGGGAVAGQENDPTAATAASGGSSAALRDWRPHATTPEWSLCRPLTAASFAGPPEAVAPRYASVLELLGRGGARDAADPAAAIRVVASLPPPAQEALLVEAVLLGLHGFPGGLLALGVTAARGGNLGDVAGGPMAGAALRSHVTVTVRATAPADAARGLPAAALDRSLVALTERLCPLVARALECRWAVEELGREGSGLVAQVSGVQAGRSYPHRPQPSPASLRV